MNAQLMARRQGRFHKGATQRNRATGRRLPEEPASEVSAFVNPRHGVRALSERGRKLKPIKGDYNTNT